MRYGITGISGSFGSALAARLANDPANTIIGITRDELRAEQIMARFAEPYGNVRVMVVAAGVSDVEAMERVFKDCDVLVHAAALKRISGSVYATEELVKTNINGTINVLTVVRKLGIPKALFISSDKACEATNLYGSTKFTAECLAVQSNAFIYPSTGGIVSCVRWGNVLGSRGSVVHIWRKQRDQRRVLEVTDCRMTRFIITMEQAVSFALQSIERMKGGEIFVPHLKSALMTQLAYAVRDENYPSTNDLAFTGLRPGGEKLHEILLTQEEPRRTVYVKDSSWPYYFVMPSHRTWSDEPYADVQEPMAVSDRFQYSSHGAERYSIEELRQLVRNIPLSREE